MQDGIESQIKLYTGYGRKRKPYILILLLLNIYQWLNFKIKQSVHVFSRI